MAYELLFKGVFRLRKNLISIGKTTISFAYNLVEDFKESKFVNIYIDDEENKMCFEPTDNESTGYAIKKRASSSIGVYARNYFGKIGEYEAQKNEKGLWEINACFVSKGQEQKASNEKLQRGSGLKMIGDMLSVSNTAICFSHEFDKKISNYDRIEFFIKNSFTDKDIIILKPTRNKIEGKKLQRKSASIYIPIKNRTFSSYVVGRYPIKTTSEGFVVEILKKK